MTRVTLARLWSGSWSLWSRSGSRSGSRSWSLDAGDGVVVFQVANADRGGADAALVVWRDGLWIRGLDELIAAKVAEALAKAKP